MREFRESFPHFSRAIKKFLHMKTKEKNKSILLNFEINGTMLTYNSYIKAP